RSASARACGEFVQPTSSSFAMAAEAFAPWAGAARKNNSQELVKRQIARMIAMQRAFRVDAAPKPQLDAAQHPLLNLSSVRKISNFREGSLNGWSMLTGKGQVFGSPGRRGPRRPTLASP